MPIYSQKHMKYEKQGIATPPNGHSSAAAKFKDAKIVKIPDDFKSWPVKISVTLMIKSSIWIKKHERKIQQGNLNINKETKAK